MLIQDSATKVMMKQKLLTSSEENMTKYLIVSRAVGLVNRSSFVLISSIYRFFHFICAINISFQFRFHVNYIAGMLIRYKLLLDLLQQLGVTTDHS